MATPQQQRRRLEEQRRKQRLARQSNKPPAIGTKRADGKVYSGQNYGYQSPASHSQLKNDGKFKTGAQSLDRVSQALSQYIPEPVKAYAQAVAASAARQQQAKDEIRQWAGIDTSKPDATQRALQGISDKTNLDRRIVDTGAALAQSAISARALKINKPSAAPVANRSVGAAARPTAIAPATRQLPRVNRPGTVPARRAKPPVQPAATQPKPPASGRTVQLQGQRPKPQDRGGRFSEQNRAAAALRRNIREGAKPSNDKVVGNKPHHGSRELNNPAVGVKTEANWKHNPAGGRGKRTEVSFKDTRSDGYQQTQRKSDTPFKKKLRGAVAKDQLGRELRKQKPYDTVHGSYEAGPKATATNLNTRQAQARDRVIGEGYTNGVLKGKPTGSTGNRKFEATRYSDGSFKNIKGERVRLGNTRGDLHRLANFPKLRQNAQGGRTTARISPAKGQLRRSKTPAKPQSTAGKPLGGASKRIAFQNTYHGTSARDAVSIRANGYRPSATGVYGPGVYTGNKKMAQQYASSAGARAGDKGAVLRHRVPKKNQANVPFEKPQQGQRVSPQSGLVQQRLRQGKTTRVDYGKGSQVTNLTKGQADKTLVKPNGNIRLSKAQQAKAKSRSERLSHGSVSRSEAGYFKPGRRQVNQEQIAQNIERQLKANKNGFTVDPRTGKKPTRGTQVAIDGKVLRDTSPAGIRRFVARNKDLLSRPDVKVGGWTSERSGKPVLELSRRVRNSAEAKRLGKKFQQEGVWDSKAGKYIPTGGTDQLRHTKGAQTKGGSRIGGQTATSRLKVNRQGTVKKPVRATTGKTQGTKGGNANLGNNRPRKANLGNIQRGAKKFTPATRAQAVERANRQNRGVRGKYAHKVNNAIGVESTKTTYTYSDGTRDHNIAFSNSSQKLAARGRDDLYGSRRDIGEKPKSKSTEKLRKAGLKDMMGRMLDVDQFDTVSAAPTTKSRGILYNRSSKGALGTRRGEGNVESVRVGPNMWINKEDGGKRVKFDPNSLKEPLTKQTKTQATRVGKAAGGTSKKPALIERPKNTVRNPKANDTKTRSAAAIRKRQEANLAKARAAKAEKAARRAARTPNSDTIRERQGVVRTTQRSRVSRDQRERTRASTAEQNWDNGVTRPRTQAEQAAIQRFTDQRAGGREVDRGGRRTWNGSNETRRLRIRRR